MSETRYDVSISIDRLLDGLPSSSPLTPSIVRIDDYLKISNENLHVPQLVSIGPLHHAKPHLQKMEQHKFRYLKMLLNRQNVSTVNEYVVVIKSLEGQARRCYSDPVDFSSDEFVQMLLLDGCFIMELIRKYKSPLWDCREDPIFNYEHILCQLVDDLMLLENQVPFFILDILFNMTANSGSNPPDDLISLIRHIIGEKYPWPGGRTAAHGIAPAEMDPNHLLDLMYKTWCRSFANMTVAQRSFVKLDIHSATELREAGIGFEKDAESDLLGIKFNKGVLKIPTLVVVDGTESILRNLILYEHFFNDNMSPKYVTDYALFFHCLINSDKDVNILRLRGVLSNMLGDDDMLNQMFKRLGRNVFVSHSFCYADVFEQVNAHCSRSKHRWMANLRRKYFYNPWGYISFSAAVVLLLLTSIQAVFSVLPFAKGKN